MSLDVPALRLLLAGPLLGAGGLHRLALALEDDADEVRAVARLVVAAAGATGWRSVAAAACRADLAHLAADLLHAAGRIDVAAEAVTRHAVTAARRAEDLLAVALTAARAAEAPVAALAGAWGVVEGALGIGARP